MGKNGSIPKDPHAVAMARKRSRSLSPDRRREIAQDAANVRWERERERKRRAKAG